MYIKVIAVICFVALASAADLTVGVKGGRIIFEQNVTASPAIWRQTRNLTVNASSDEVISRVVVIDNRPEKNGEAKVVEGGAGDKNVTIELQGPAVFRGFDFSIQVFATPENIYAPDSRLPTFIGVAGQNPQVPHPKDINLKGPSMQVPKKENGDDVILGAPKPTPTSTTLTSTTATSTAATSNNGNQDKINNPTLVGKEQTRLNRDTEGQKTKEQTLIPSPVHVTPVAVEPSKNIKANENTNKPAVEEHDEDWKKVIDSIFADNSTQKTQKSKPNEGKVQPVIPKDAHTDDDKRKARKTEEESVVPAVHKQLAGDEKHTTEESVVPAVHKQLTGDEKHTKEESVVPAVHKQLTGDEKHTTPKSDLSSTTAKNIGQEKYGPRVIPLSSEGSSTAYAGQLTTESSKLPESKTTQDLEKNLKGHHFEHPAAVPLPYHNH